MYYMYIKYISRVFEKKKYLRTYNTSVVYLKKKYLLVCIYDTYHTNKNKNSVNYQIYR